MPLDYSLCKLLESWGPLEALPGVVPEPMDRDFDHHQTVRLRSYYGQLSALAEAYAAVSAWVGNRNELSETLAERSREALQDVTVHLLFEPDRVLFDPEPRSLRAFLWRYVFGLWGRSPTRLCKRCKAKFDVPYSRGRPPLYCPEHRNARSHKQASRLQPSSFSQDQNDEQEP